MSQMTNCNCTAPAVEIPVHGLKLSLDEQALRSIQSPPVIGAGVPVGTILLLPFRKNELPVGWYFCDGAAIALDSIAGTALNALPLGYKADWGIAVENDTITLPSLFSEDGRGCFPRPVNGEARQVGVTEGDAIQDHAHRWGGLHNYAGGNASYINIQGTPGKLGAIADSKQTSGVDATPAFPDPRYAQETRPLNIGMTPAIYLGV